MKALEGNENAKFIVEYKLSMESSQQNKEYLLRNYNFSKVATFHLL